MPSGYVLGHALGLRPEGLTRALTRWLDPRVGINAVVYGKEWGYTVGDACVWA